MLTAEDIVVALGPGYSPMQELPEGVLLVRLNEHDVAPVEIRIEAEWVRLFALIGPFPSDARELRALLRSNEKFDHIRYGIENNALMLRADIPIRLWRDSELLGAMAEVERTLERTRGKESE